ncbi:MAG: MFS transporter [Acidiferrobacteraceae bacterium]
MSSPAEGSRRSRLLWVSILYFAEGLPYGLFADVIPVQWREQGVPLARIGALSLLGLAWTLKFLWAPAIDHVRRHRRWMASADIAMAVIALFFAWHTSFDTAAWFAVGGFTLLSATNDIAIDGYTIDLLPKGEMGIANGLRIGFYRVGLLAAGFVLALSSFISWRGAYFIAAGLLVVNAIACLNAPQEPAVAAAPVLGFRSELRALARNPAAIGLVLLLVLAALKLGADGLHLPLPPALVWTLLGIGLLAFILGRRRGGRAELAELRRGPMFGALMEMLSRPGMPVVLLFILTYKLAESAMGFMVKPFWVDAGFSAAEIGLVSVNIGIALSIAGGLVGGWATDRLGLFRALWILGFVQALPNLVYYAAAALFMPHAAGAPITDGERVVVYLASATESFASGVGTSAFLAFLMAIVNKRRSAAEFALLSSVFAFSRSLAGFASGIGAARLGYAHYFLLTFLLAFPAYLFLPWVKQMLLRVERFEAAD